MHKKSRKLLQIIYWPYLVQKNWITKNIHEKIENTNHHNPFKNITSVKYCKNIIVKNYLNSTIHSIKMHRTTNNMRKK